MYDNIENQFAALAKSTYYYQHTEFTYLKYSFLVLKMDCNQPLYHFMIFFCKGVVSAKLLFDKIYNNIVQI